MFEATRYDGHLARPGGLRHHAGGVAGRPARRADHRRHPQRRPRGHRDAARLPSRELRAAPACRLGRAAGGVRAAVRDGDGLVQHAWRPRTRRRTEEITVPQGAQGGEVGRAIDARASEAAEEGERNAWQADGAIDRVILVALLARLFAGGAVRLSACGRQARQPAVDAGLAGRGGRRAGSAAVGLSHLAGAGLGRGQPPFGQGRRSRSSCSASCRWPWPRPTAARSRAAPGRGWSARTPPPPSRRRRRPREPRPGDRALRRVHGRGSARDRRGRHHRRARCSRRRG